LSVDDVERVSQGAIELRAFDLVESADSFVVVSSMAWR
jgi:hypothetical protein